MKASLSLDSVNGFVLGKHRLLPPKSTSSIPSTVSDIFGLHATSAATPYLSLFARIERFQHDDLDKELYEKKTLAKIRCVRGTIYVVPVKKLPGVMAATQRLVMPASEKFAQFMGISASEYEKAAVRIIAAVSGKGLTSAEIKAELGAAAIPGLNSIINLMCDEGHLAKGKPRAGWKSNQHVYFAFDEYYPDVNLKGINEIAGTRQVVADYIHAFGPVTETDIAWWTGLTKARIRAAIDEMKIEVEIVQINGLEGEHFMDTSQIDMLVDDGRAKPDLPRFNLLPLQDPYIIGYRDRDRYLDPDLAEYIFDRGGNPAPVIMIKGRVSGIWDLQEKPQPRIKLFLFQESTKKIRAEIEAEAARLGSFITGKEPNVEWKKTMKPLSQLTMGSFMSPLPDNQ